MSDDGMQMLREFRDQVLTPDAESCDRVLAAILSTGRLPQPDAFSRLRVRIPAGLRRRRRLFVACALAATAALAAVALLLASPWSGPGAITPAEAATVLLRTKAAVTPRPGWVFHWRLAVSMAAYPGADHYSHGYFEIWQQAKRPYRLRVLTTFPDLRRPVETGGILTPYRIVDYDPQTRSFYWDNTLYFGQRFQDPVAELRHAIASGKARVTGRTHLDGRPVYRITYLSPASMESCPSAEYVDAKTYVPVRLESDCGPELHRLGDPRRRQVENVTVYEYLPPTPANLYLANIRAHHPHAPTRYEFEMPPAFRVKVHPWQRRPGG